MNPQVKLDHVGVAIRDLERGRAAYERLGFKLTPRSIHRGSPQPGAPVVPFGSGNHCAMFREGYLEVVGLTDPTMYSNIKPMVARYEGAHIVAFSVDSAEAVNAALKARGIPVEGTRQLERNAAFGEMGTDTRRAAFRTMYFDAAAYPEARILYIEHLTPDVLWQPHLLDHPNGTIAISDVFFCVREGRRAAEKYAELFATEARATADGEWRLDLAHGAVWIVTPEAWAQWAPGAATPPLPGPVGVGFRVRGLAATGDLLESRGVPAREGRNGGIWVGPEHACGTAIYFFSSSDGQR